MGTQYYDYAKVSGGLTAGQRLVLRREPENPYDPLAVEVLTEDRTKLGYLPRSDNSPYARLLDAGKTFGVEIWRVDAEQYHPLTVSISFLG